MSSNTSEPFSAEKYFATQMPPSNLEEMLEGVREFVERNHLQRRKIVLVTSGGTTVPLELNVVRFLDNFSAGTRGATSAEYFLSHDYAVIFLHRQFSQQPFLRHYSHSTNPFLDLLEIEEPPQSSSYLNSNPNVRPRITVNPSPQALPLLLRVLRENKRVKQLGTLHTVTFVTVDDYLFLLRGIASVISAGGKEGVGRDAMFYLAAAVSDFFLPRQKMSEHKIQSGKGSLHIEMDQVPKILKPLVNEWTPEGYIVSFKLETDPTILIPKARQALERYGHQLVIGNELNTRKYKVVFVERRTDTSTGRKAGDKTTYRHAKETILDDMAASQGISTPVMEKSEWEERYSEDWIRIGEEEDLEIESLIVERLVGRHKEWIKAGERA